MSLCPLGVLGPLFYYLAMSQRMPAWGQGWLWLMSWLTWLHASGPDGATVEQFWKAVLVRNFQVAPPAGLLGVYEVLALGALALELRYLGRRAARGFGVAFLGVNLLATPLGWALRAWFGS